MSEDKEMSSGQPGDKISDLHGDKQPSTSGVDTVKYETYKKLLGEKKLADARYKDAMDLVAAAELNTAKASGDTNELLVRYQDENRKLIEDIKTEKANRAKATLAGQVKTAAAKMGCLDSKSLIDLMDLSGIPVDPDTYAADDDALRMLLEDEKKSRPFYFGKPAPNIQDVQRQDAVIKGTTPAEHDISKMDRDQLAAYVLKYGTQFT